jgi:hypothetical protein
MDGSDVRRNARQDSTPCRIATATVRVARCVQESSRPHRAHVTFHRRSSGACNLVAGAEMQVRMALVAGAVTRLSLWPPSPHVIRASAAL